MAGKNVFTTPKGKKAADKTPSKKPGLHGDKRGARKALSPPKKGK